LRYIEFMRLKQRPPEQTNAEMLCELKHLVAQCERTSFQGQHKPARIAGHLAKELERNEPALSITQLKLMAKALQHATRHQSSPGAWQAALARVSTRQRVLSGEPDPKTIHQIARTLDIEMGGVMVKDSQRPLTKDFFTTDNAIKVNAFEIGKFFFIDLGADCVIKVRMRFVDGYKPNLTVQEMSRVRSATAIGRISCSSNTIMASGGGSKKVVVKTLAQDCLICAYMVGYGRKQEVVCVICANNGQLPEYQEISLDLY